VGGECTATRVNGLVAAGLCSAEFVLSLDGSSAPASGRAVASPGPSWVGTDVVDAVCPPEQTTNRHTARLLINRLELLRRQIWGHKARSISIRPNNGRPRLEPASLHPNRHGKEERER
jgi:hypothetical protein